MSLSVLFSEWFNLFQFTCFIELSVIQIPPELQRQPEICRHTEKFSQSERCSRCYSTASVYNFVYPLVGNMDCFCKFTLGQVHWYQKFLKQHLPRMCRRTVCWHTHHFTSPLYAMINMLYNCSPPNPPVGGLKKDSGWYKVPLRGILGALSKYLFITCLCLTNCITGKNFIRVIHGFSPRLCVSAVDFLLFFSVSPWFTFLSASIPAFALYPPAPSHRAGMSFPSGNLFRAGKYSGTDRAQNPGNRRW